MGVNDFHLSESGELQQGLGADEPSERDRARLAAGRAAEKARLEEVARIEAEQQAQAAALASKESALEQRIRELEERERALIARESSIEPPQAPKPPQTGGRR